ncbi:MAG: hypothetical protein WB646_19565 [Steroidobacteraceae bacterium]
MDLVLRALIGGSIVSLFSLLGDVLKPKSFAGLFGAAPSIALATLGITIGKNGAHYAALEARSMILGSAALFLYSISCMYLMGVKRVHSAVATLALLPVWGLAALGLWVLVLK